MMTFPLSLSFFNLPATAGAHETQHAVLVLLSAQRTLPDLPAYVLHSSRSPTPSASLSAAS
jgi:hypothetical protein